MCLMLLYRSDVSMFAMDVFVLTPLMHSHVRVSVAGSYVSVEVAAENVRVVVRCD